MSTWTHSLNINTSLNALTLSLRCPRCLGYVETPPCWNRLRGNAPSAWRSAPDSIHTCRDFWRGLLLQTGVRTGTRSGISANKKVHLSSQAGGKAEEPKRSVLPLTPHRQPYFGTRPFESNNTLTLSCHTTPPIYPHAPPSVALILPCNIRDVRTASKKTGGR